MLHAPGSPMKGCEDRSPASSGLTNTHRASPVSDLSSQTSFTAVKACVSCARAKAKCVPGKVSTASCERCSRLRRPCEPSQPRARAQPRKRKALDVDHLAKQRVEKLEERLDGIVTLLKASKDPATQTTESIPQLNLSIPTLNHTLFDAPVNSSLPTAPDLYISENAENWDERLFRGGTIRQRFALIGSYNPSIDQAAKTPEPKFSLIGVDLGVEDPAKLLDIFRDEMNPNFPFISIPESATIDTMRKDQPSLLTAVMAVTSRDSTQQLLLGKALMRQIADRMVVNGERNLDLLLAILTYAGWCYHQFFDIPQLTLLISFAATLVGDLRYMKPFAKDSRGFFDAAIRESTKARGQCIDTLKPVTATVRLMEERRAALGYWFLTSVVGSFFQRVDSAKWTSYLDECCTLLYNSGHHRDDRFASALIRMQLISEKITLNPGHGSLEGLPHAAPPVLYLKALQREMNHLRADFSVEMENDPFLLLNYHNLEVSLYKIGLARSESLSAFTTQDFNRLEYLFACTEAVRAFFDGLLRIPANKYHCISVKLNMDLTWNMGVVQMLSTFDHPDWDLAWLRQTISFPELLGKLSSTFSEVKAALTLDPNTTERLDMFSQSARKLGWIKMFVEKAISGVPVHSETSRGAEIPFTAGEMYDLNGSDFMGYVDDAWMKDMLGSWEY
ncbi:hypothetical protein BKA64DRAFT_357833 [Cadophora sp. MPI-SDFR-AT-0126]|nr:hypothetical protein BKA64DRAFT_357833 [Leotiomycetes sp. MPI-SDFR-AT-0126]